METENFFNKNISKKIIKEKPSLFIDPSKNSMNDYIQLKRSDRDINRDKEGMDFACKMASRILIFLLLACFAKIMQDLTKGNDIKLENYTNFLIPILTTTVGFILGKNSK